jgi:hypothetical protein
MERSQQHSSGLTVYSARREADVVFAFHPKSGFRNLGVQVDEKRAFR